MSLDHTNGVLTQTQIFKVDDVGIDFIKSWEKFSPVAYTDQKGVWTIGYGDTTGVKPGDTITEAEALARLLKKIQSVENTLTWCLRPSTVLAQNQVNALVSFIYNIGETAFRGSTALKLLNQGKFGQVPQWMMVWNKIKINGANGVVVVVSKGLTNRRAAEVELFNKP